MHRNTRGAFVDERFFVICSSLSFESAQSLKLRFMFLFPSRFRALILSVCVAGAFALHAGAQNSFVDAKPMFQLQDARISELSGLVSSTRYPNHFWAHNDSGDSARLFLINSRGETVAIVNLEGVVARDWEDMALAGEWIYLGDIGDNFRVLENVRVHRIREPRVDIGKRNQEISVKAGMETMTLHYPDGARDAETLAAAPDGRLLVVSKSGEGSNFYALNTPFRPSSSAVLERFATGVKFGQSGIFTKLTTAGDVSRDGRKLVVQTYSALYEWPLSRPFDFKTINWNAVQTQTLPAMKQSESVCYSLDGKRILVSSEGKGAPFYALNSMLK